MTNYQTFSINNKKLGFTLNKESNTPTIEKITENGALEKELINTGTNISPGCEIYSINNKIIEGFNYSDSMDIIRSYTLRPITLKIKCDIRIKTRKISIKEMENISDEATQKALKDLVKYKMNQNKIEDSDSDDFDEDDRIYRKLEEKIRKIELEKLNIEICLKEDLKIMDNKLNILKKINNIYDKITKNINENVEKINNTHKSDVMSKILSKMNLNYNKEKEILINYIEETEFTGLQQIIKDSIKYQDFEIKKYNGKYNYIIFIRLSKEYVDEFFKIAVFLIFLWYSYPWY